MGRRQYFPKTGEANSSTTVDAVDQDVLEGEGVMTRAVEIGDLIVHPDGTVETVPEGFVSTSCWTYETVKVRKGCCLTVRCRVRLQTLPDALKRELRRRGCGPWLDDQDAGLEFNATCVRQLPTEHYAPSERLLSLDDLEKRIRDLPLPEQARV
jgi:hypothetical protein